MTTNSLSYLVAASLLLFGNVAHAELKTQEVEYKQGDTTLQGFFAWDDAIKGKRPGVLVIHEWWGHNEHAREQARRFAKAGYVGLAIDMYGKGKVATHPDDAKKFMTEATANSAVVKARFDAALALLKKRPEVNAKQIGAVGYCFGGAVALDMARAGEPLAFVGTFHGALGTKTPAKKGAIKPRLLVMTGTDDPMVDKAAVDGFKSEMTAAGAKYEVIEYPGAKHAFTNPDAGKHNMPALAYDAKADQDSFAALLKLMSELFGPPKTAAAAAAPTAAKPGAPAPATTGKLAAPAAPAAQAPAKSAAPAAPATAKPAAPATPATGKLAAPAAPKPAAPAGTKPAEPGTPATPPKAQ